jgi:hypothetical protein
MIRTLRSPASSKVRTARCSKVRRTSGQITSGSPGATSRGRIRTTEPAVSTRVGPFEVQPPPKVRTVTVNSSPRVAEAGKVTSGPSP